MRVAIRADGSQSIGFGHIMRCAALAEALSARGTEVHFLVREIDDVLLDRLSDAGYIVHVLPGKKLDSTESVDILANGDWSWMVVDHYGLSADWEKDVAFVGVKVLVIDDVADRPHVCDILLDQNLYPDPAARYESLAPEGCRMLLGPRYALLRREFAEARSGVHPRRGEIKRMLVCMGGADNLKVTEAALEALDSRVREGLEVDVVIGTDESRRQMLAERFVGLTRLVIHDGDADLPHLMASADLAIGAGGVMTWERCCMGLPALIVSVAQNQVEIAENVAAAGAAVYLGRAEEVDAETISAALEELEKGPESLARMSVSAMDLVDGLGAERVAKVMSDSGVA